MCACSAAQQAIVQFVTNSEAIAPLGTKPIISAKRATIFGQKPLFRISIYYNRGRHGNRSNGLVARVGVLTKLNLLRLLHVDHLLGHCLQLSVLAVLHL